LDGICANAEEWANKVREVKKRGRKREDKMRFFIAKVKFSLAEIQLKYKVVQI
jgi:hypothetical protein